MPADRHVNDEVWLRMGIDMIELKIDPSDQAALNSEPKTVQVPANVQGRKNRVGYCKSPATYYWHNFRQLCDQLKFNIDSMISLSL